ncbi:DNA (cytosine-5-)-methyltransferase [Paenibacillus camelliae]|uniref:DNA (cytosine-5-)-methyltransferase n=1 Tax=Paenibacillus camelliae TaxID=512410 RepID=UPI00203E45F5|nr:DNA (cytosine-5-)-methyltransferase [Paenibacillus camelliae]MCM3634264.1 DNA (cytosine-5-)-methyltransferase [Paenibacillus camelliae]
MVYYKRGGARVGAGRSPLSEEERKKGFKVYFPQAVYEDILKYGEGNSFSEKVYGLISSEMEKRKLMQNEKVKFIDLFAGMGGLRLGFEQAFNKFGLKTECVLTSEIKPHAVNALKENFPQHNFVGDITKVQNDEIPDFDFLLAGFPCQAFSSAGKGHGFLDTRGTLFFEIERILQSKRPYGFILENVEGLVTHDRENKHDPIGRTLKTIVTSLESLNYTVCWKIMDSKDFGVPQSRKRIYIVGSLNEHESITLDNFKQSKTVLSDILEEGLPTLDTPFTNSLFKHYSPHQLYGKSIKDKRGGKNNIHSWDLEIKGPVTVEQKELLNALLKERRKKHWADKIGITWMDGMPLTIEQIETFFPHKNLLELLDDLVAKGYLAYEHPKEQVKIPVIDNQYKIERIPDITKPKGYNIVSGKLSFEFSRILDPRDIAPTLVAMDVSTLGVIDNSGIRQLTLREGLRLFGYPETYTLKFLDNNPKKMQLGFDLLGNTVTVPVIFNIAERLCSSYIKTNNKEQFSLSS